MKLNLGCGDFPLAGFLNVDKSSHCKPDKLMDLEILPWDFKDNCAEEIVMSHVLEHIGQQASEFEKIIRELYRVMANRAVLTIAIPDPYHDNFWGDPTHCRPITPQLLNLFSREFLNKYKGTAITPIAFMWEIDFEVLEVKSTIDPEFQKYAKRQNLPLTAETFRFHRNSLLDHSVKLRAHKPFRLL